MLSLVDDFRDLTTIVNAPFVAEDVNLREVIDFQVGQRKEVLQKRHIQVSIDEQPVLKANRPLVHELIRCLLDNALVHTGDREITIQFKAEKIEGEWVMGICNSGSHIDPSIVAAIFQPLTRKGRNRSEENRGLGLTKVKKIVEHHHGQIWVENLADAVCFKYTLTGKSDD
jgi:light-regulated signal transduction histidine kinase (bacteriophytochrome)